MSFLREPIHRSFNCIGSYHASALGPVQYNAVQLESGEFSNSLNGIHDGQSVIYMEHFGRRVSIEAMLDERYIGFLIPLAGHLESRYWGRLCGPNEIIAGPGRTPIDMTFASSARHVVALTPLEVFRREFETVTGRASDDILRAGHFVPIDPARLSAASKLFRHTLAQVNTNGQSFARDTPMGAVLTNYLIDIFDQRLVQDNHQGNGYAYVNRAVEIWKESGGTADLFRISRQLQISRRSLEQYFARHFGVTPYQYFLKRRMTLAHRRLLDADPKTTTVSEIAVGLGFEELGRFAGDYRKQFGESPSETLRRASSSKFNLGGMHLNPASALAFAG